MFAWLVISNLCFHGFGARLEITEGSRCFWLRAFGKIEQEDGVRPKPSFCAVGPNSGVTLFRLHDISPTVARISLEQPGES
jgi:hypothetical protein